MRVLIADDDPIIRLDLKQVLESLGFDVIAEADNGQSAVELAKDLRPDVCVLDVKMPTMDGIDAALALTESAVAPVVLLTAYSDMELVSRAKEAGIYGYLVKPYKPSDLPPAIEIARARFEQHDALTKEVADMQERLEARKTIEKAKGVLMLTQGLTESEAYRHIQQEAMNKRTSMREYAEQIVAQSN